MDLNATAAPESSFRMLERLGTDPKVYYRSKREWVKKAAGGQGPGAGEAHRNG
jgi:hypothetical protein